MLIKKYSEIYTPPVPMGVTKVGGEFRCILRNSMGGIVQDTDWFPNLITNTGLANMHTQSWFNNLHIGASSTAPAFTNSTLGSWLAVASSLLSQTEGPGPVAPNYEYYTTRGWRFNAGVGTGTVAELGISWSSTNVNMCIRALVSPTIVKAADQVLDVYYRFKLWPNLSDVVGVVPIAGDNYNYTLRSKDLDENDFQRTFTQMRWPLDGSFISAYQDNIAAITSAPSVTSGGSSSNAETYVPTVVGSGSDSGLGTGYQDTQYRYHLDEANSAGIRSVTLRGPTSISQKGIQCQFNRVSDNAKILKDNTKELYFTFRFQYAR